MRANLTTGRARRPGAALVLLFAATILAGSAPAAATVGPSPAPATRGVVGAASIERTPSTSLFGPGRWAAVTAALSGPPVTATAGVDASPARRIGGPRGHIVPPVARRSPPAVARVVVHPRPATHRGLPQTYRGRNHVWSSDFGLDRSVRWFACSRSAPPAMAVYRWGCAGRNNVYLLAHAGGPFGRLHDVYVRGHLRRGMTVTYADADGTVHRYRVAWWKVVLPTEGDFAFAPLSRPSMTLQTCVGANSRYRLVVRLYRDD